MIKRAINIALRNLLHDPPRTTIALAGSGFSLIVIFMQIGFLRATQRTATLVLDKLDFDLVVTSKNYQFFSDPGSFPMARIRTAGSVPGVATVVPLYVRSGLWRSLSTTPPPGGPLAKPMRNAAEPTEMDRSKWRRRSILVLSYFTSDRPFLPGIHGLQQQGNGFRIDELERPFAVFIDRRSRWEFGPQVPGTSVELNNRLFRLAGTFEMGTGFAADGAALLSHQNFARAFGDAALDQPTLGLIKLSKKANVDEVLAQLRNALSGSRADAESAGLPSGVDADVRILRRSDIERQERTFWLREKTIGVLFVMGLVISFLVGVVVFYQVLSSDIADHLSEYATLKAIGYSNTSVASIMIGQASILGFVGYLLALLVATGLYSLVRGKTGIPMTIVDGWVLGIPLLLCQVMSSGSALVSIRKLALADPAELFR